MNWIFSFWKTPANAPHVQIQNSEHNKSLTLIHNRLPKDVLVDIFQKLSLMDLVRASKVCKKWNALVQERALQPLFYQALRFHYPDTYKEYIYEVERGLFNCQQRARAVGLERSFIDKLPCSGAFQSPIELDPNSESIFLRYNYVYTIGFDGGINIISLADGKSKFRFKPLFFNECLYGILWMYAQEGTKVITNAFCFKTGQVKQFETPVDGQSAILSCCGPLLITQCESLLTLTHVEIKTVVKFEDVKMNCFRQQKDFIYFYNTNKSEHVFYLVQNNEEIRIKEAFFYVQEIKLHKNFAAAETANNFAVLFDLKEKTVQYFGVGSFTFTEKFFIFKNNCVGIRMYLATKNMHTFVFDHAHSFLDPDLFFKDYFCELDVKNISIWESKERLSFQTPPLHFKHQMTNIHVHNNLLLISAWHAESTFVYDFSSKTGLGWINGSLSDKIKIPYCHGKLIVQTYNKKFVIYEM
jgi:hypothetical protein